MEAEEVMLLKKQKETLIELSQRKILRVRNANEKLIRVLAPKSDTMPVRSWL